MPAGGFSIHVEPAQVEALFALARKSFGPAGILINTAGVGAQKYLLDTPLETLAAMYDVNVKGTFLCTQAGALLGVAGLMGGDHHGRERAAAAGPGWRRCCRRRASRHGGAPAPPPSRDRSGA